MGGCVGRVVPPAQFFFERNRTVASICNSKDHPQPVSDSEDSCLQPRQGQVTNNVGVSRNGLPEARVTLAPFRRSISATPALAFVASMSELFGK
ncbi:uncharacterized protein N7500_008460 [Penicillium coprophilum]|uniref:uncharacterized protein n=1 Tax=Penicillium coprophilum TaxID=36646 RepID=UPI00239A53F4|nr:uncharacterized protein N7500_008460 [Penicillium coprophilum]KAJ5158809.1 hypothetical protein N7500_008460 [Penicillium coprophilum]